MAHLLLDGSISCLSGIAWAASKQQVTLCRHGLCALQHDLQQQLLSPSNQSKQTSSN